MSVIDHSSPAWQHQGSASGLTRAFSHPHGLVSFDWDHHHFDMVAYPMPLDQVEFDLPGVQTCRSAYVEPNSSFESNESDTILAHLDLSCHSSWTSPGPEHGVGPMLAEKLTVNNVLQADDESPGYSVSSSFGILDIPRTASPEQYVSFSGEYTEMSSPTTTDLSGCTADPLDILPTGWVIGNHEAGFSARDPSTLDLAIPVPRIYPSFQPEENIQTAGPENLPYTDILPSKESPGEPMYFCLWEDGQLCGQVVTPTSLPLHLAQHGIQKMDRQRRMKCHWAGCKKEEMNRESIVRHIREVHLGLKRSSKRVSEPYPRGTGLPRRSLTFEVSSI